MPSPEAENTSDERDEWGGHSFGDVCTHRYTPEIYTSPQSRDRKAAYRLLVDFYHSDSASQQPMPVEKLKFADYNDGTFVRFTQKERVKIDKTEEGPDTKTYLGVIRPTKIPKGKIVPTVFYFPEKSIIKDNRKTYDGELRYGSLVVDRTRHLLSGYKAVIEKVLSIEVWDESIRQN